MKTISANELKIETFHSKRICLSPNCFDPKIKITHIKTGIMVESDKFDSQDKNKQFCMKLLRELLNTSEYNNSSWDAQALVLDEIT